MLVGICRVNQLAERSGTALTKLTVQAIEDLAVHTYKTQKKKREHVTQKIGHEYRVSGRKASKQRSPLRVKQSPERPMHPQMG